jgi:hypothetical protein
MTLPACVDGSRLSVKTRKSRRLKYMLTLALLNTHMSTSMHLLAKLCGYDHSSIFNAIKRGSLTYEMAKAIQDCLGREHIKFEHLLDPMSVS